MVCVIRGKEGASASCFRQKGWNRFWNQRQSGEKAAEHCASSVVRLARLMIALLEAGRGCSEDQSGTWLDAAVSSTSSEPLQKEVRLVKFALTVLCSACRPP